MLTGVTSVITRVICVALVALPCMYVANRHRLAEELVQSSGAGTSPRNDSQHAQRQKPLRQEIKGQGIIMERVRDPKGVLLLFPGCQHTAMDWWETQESCQTCIGLPEEMSIVRRAVQRGYTVVALTAEDRADSKCWVVAPPPQETLDMKHTKLTLEVLMEREGWRDTPIYALGASSGGSMVALLPFHLRLQGICLQIMGVPPDIYTGMDAEKLPAPFPPALFVHMARDRRTAAVVARDVAALRAQGVTAEERKVEPLPLSAAFFSDRIEGVSPEVSAQIYSALKTGGMLDADDFLKEDPRRTAQQWQALLQEEVPAAQPMTLEADRSPIFEELNVAWASHELVSDTTDAMLDWFEQNAGASKA